MAQLARYHRHRAPSTVLCPQKLRLHSLSALVYVCLSERRSTEHMFIYINIYKKIHQVSNCEKRVLSSIGSSRLLFYPSPLQCLPNNTCSVLWCMCVGLGAAQESHTAHSQSSFQPLCRRFLSSPSRIPSSEQMERKYAIFSLTQRLRHDHGDRELYIQYRQKLAWFCHPRQQQHWIVTKTINHIICD